MTDDGMVADSGQPLLNRFDDGRQRSFCKSHGELVANNELAGEQQEDLQLWSTALVPRWRGCHRDEACRVGAARNGELLGVEHRLGK